MLSLKQWQTLSPDNIAHYHGYSNFIEFIMSQDLDTGGGVALYSEYRDWYMKKYTPLGKALDEN